MFLYAGKLILYKGESVGQPQNKEEKERQYSWINSNFQASLTPLWVLC